MSNQEIENNVRQCARIAHEAIQFTKSIDIEKYRAQQRSLFNVLERVREELGEEAKNDEDLTNAYVLLSGQVDVVSFAKGIAVQSAFLKPQEEVVIDVEYTQEFISVNLGDGVQVPEPEDKDIWNCSFCGRAIEKKEDTNGTILIVVEDSDGDCWDIEEQRLKVITRLR